MKNTHKRGTYLVIHFPDGTKRRVHLSGAVEDMGWAANTAWITAPEGAWVEIKGGQADAVTAEAQRLWEDAPRWR